AGLPGVNEAAVGVSPHGRLAFRPDNAPEKWQGTLFGHVFTHGTINLAQLTDNEIPLTIKGDVLLNLDSISADGWKTNGAVSQLLKADIVNAFKQLKGVSVGVNGQIDLTPSVESKGGSGEGKAAAGLDLSLPAVKRTAIYDSGARTTYFHGAQPSFWD